MIQKTVADEHTILVIEDDPELGQMLQAYFGEQGFQATVMPSGEEALGWVNTAVADVVVLDIHLPGMDGFEVCRRLRQNNRFRHTPVIFLTERRAQGDRLAGLELGAVDYMTKPFDIQELGLRVRNAVERAEMTNESNPVTGLPERSISDQQIADLLKRPDWAVVVAGVSGLRSFSESYGFVVADDVARANGLMIQQIVKASGDCEFLGHLDAAEFIIVTSPGQADKLAEQCRRRLEATIPYFYPAADWQALQDKPEAERLTPHSATLSSADGSISTLKQFYQALQSAL
ncbi:MAG: response regulator [Chloroflexota bacterium]